MAATRRSMRSASTFYKANGRDYLASELGCTHHQLNTWLKSTKVRPHMQLWYKLCILGRWRCKEVIQWIENGTLVGNVGYFYNPSEFQNDVSLMCLGEGNVEAGAGYQISIYADPMLETYDWSTQEIWARSAWRIVQQNAGHGDIFEVMVLEHAARAYALVIDMLSIAFHSIVFRRSDSVWEELIGFHTGLPRGPSEDEAGAFIRNKIVIDLADELDQSPEPDRYPDLEEEEQSDVSSVAESEATTIYTADDGDFEDPATPGTKATSVRSSPWAPVKPKKWRSVEDEEDDTTVVARSVERWLREKSATPTPIRHQGVKTDSA